MHKAKTAAWIGVGMLLALPGFARSSSGLHWEKLHVFHTEPSAVFARLGLTHITRNGYTRGLKKGMSDPTFPPGLTDVVPYDADHTLLVRGTKAGVAEFRQRVQAADVPDPHWQVSLTLLRRDDDDFHILSGQNKAIAADKPLVVTFDNGADHPQYQVSVHLNHDGSVAVTCRTALTLETSPSAATPGVFTPAQVWTPPLTKDTRLGDTLAFDDRGADRAAARQRLGQPAGAQSDDYQVQIEVSPVPLPTSPLPADPSSPSGAAK